VAGVQLRGRAGPLATRVHWPSRTASPSRPGLLVLVPGAGSAAGARALDGTEALCSALCRHAGFVVLAVSGRRAPSGVDTPALEDGITATTWAADHAGELGADARRLVVAGVAAGAAVAAAVALAASHAGWPTIARQVLLRPDLKPAAAPGFPAGPGPLDLALDVRRLAGVAPATLVVAGDGGPAADDGRRYAARLRRAGVEVEVLHGGAGRDGAAAPLGPVDDRTIVAVARSLRRSLDAAPGDGVRHQEVIA
jgi:acetyl esterase/lipase